MQAVQLLPTLAFGDAVGNDVLAIDRALKQAGIETAVYAENIDRRLPAGTAQPYDRFPKLSSKDVILYHASTGTRINQDLPGLGGRKVMIYHNITPPEFFRPYSSAAESLCRAGYEGIRSLRNEVEYAIADSGFNRQELRNMGYSCPIDVCPVLIPFDDYQKKPNQQLIRKYGADGYTNLLFLGRIAPNKKQEDVILSFAYYRKYLNPRSRLFLVGSWNGMESYYQRLQDYVRLMQLEDVIFTGSVPFADILAYYRIADCFVCMSEHEGFCVPLVEAMFFDIPVLAYDCCAITETLGEGGLLMKEKEPKQTALAIDRILTDPSLRGIIHQGQQRRLNELRYDTVLSRFEQLLKKYLADDEK
jgi:glycosyltransferase involved in cell wall biosynthesis